MTQIDFMIMCAKNTLKLHEKAIEQAMDSIRMIAQDRPENVAESMASYVERLKEALIKKSDCEAQLQMLEALKKEDK